VRIGISRKIFIVFFSLTAFTLVMSATVYMGISKMNETTDMTRAISELQAKILLVNAHAHRVLIHDTHTHGEPDYQAFRQKLEEVLELGRYVATFQLQAEGETRRDLKELPVLVGYYWNAYEELEGRLEKGERLLMENDALLTALRERGAALGGETRNRYFQVLSKISLLHGQSYHQLLPGAVREGKKAAGWERRLR
jgi:hypothetical protein